MSQTDTNSSPVSCLPETSPVSATPPTSSPTHSQHLPEDSARPETPTPTSEGIRTADIAPSEPTLPRSPTSNDPDMAKTSTSPPLKRGREEDEGEEHSPPPKKAAVPSKNNEKAKPAPKKRAPKKATPPPRQPSSRPSRTRKAPERFEDLQEAKPKPLKELPVKKAASKVFDPVYITTNSTSRLGKVDIYHMLLEPAAWSSLSSEQQSTLVSILPSTPANTALLAAIHSGVTDTRPQAFTISNDCFRTDVAKFQEDLKNGHLAKTWQAAAEQAVVERAAGAYDAWKAEEAESWWGQKSKSK